MPRIVHFELNVKDADKTIKFYEAVFGWKIENPIKYYILRYFLCLWIIIILNFFFFIFLPRKNKKYTLKHD